MEQPLSCVVLHTFGSSLRPLFSLAFIVSHGLSLNLLARLFLLVLDRAISGGATNVLRLAPSSTFLGGGRSTLLVAAGRLAATFLARWDSGPVGHRVRGGVFLELAVDGLGGAERAALGELEVGPVGVGAGVVDDRDEESHLFEGGVSEGFHLEEMRWSELNFFGVGPFGFRLRETGHGGAVGCHRDSRMS